MWLDVSGMAWTPHRLLADRRNWYDGEFDYTGPACYELGTAGPRGGRIQWHYVGETANERARMQQYARMGSHLWETIDLHLQDGWSLYYHGCALPTKAAAVAMQNRLLARFEYDWNVVLNPRR
jgi:hypothetical protein